MVNTKSLYYNGNRYQIIFDNLRTNYLFYNLCDTDDNKDLSLLVRLNMASNWLDFVVIQAV
jgi:hypothetical protein